MSDLDDLRRTLERHADEVEQGGASVRRAAVHHRVDQARRRRGAAAAGLAASVAALAAGVALLPGPDPTRIGPTPAAQVVGVPVPDQIVATGYTYRPLVVLEGDDGTVSTTVPPSNVPRIVSWATSGDAQDVTVTGGTADQPLHLSDPDFTNWVLLAPSPEESTVEVAADSGQVGLVVFVPSDERPSGYTKDGVTSRARVAGGVLAGAVVGDLGQAEVVLPVVTRDGTMWVKAECAGGPRRAWMDVTSNGEDFLSEIRCGERLPFDMSGLSGSGTDLPPGRQVTLEARVTEGRRGPLVVDDDLQVALTVYHAARSADDEPAEVIEAAGHTWRFADQQQAEGLDPLDAVSPTDRGMVWAVADSMDGPARVDFGPGGGVTLGSAGGVSELIDAGQSVRMTAADGVPGTRRVTFYVRID